MSSSILTNIGSMTALRTLGTTNDNLLETQNRISTGKKVSSAKDNAAAWAISTIMETDVTGFNAISESLSLGNSTVAVARSSAETITDLLDQMKEKIVSAQSGSVDRDKLQADVDALKDQISSVVNAAQFNGTNLLKGSDSISVLSSLDRAEDGTVSVNNITVDRQDLSTADAVAASVDSTADAVTTAASPLTASSANTVQFETDGDTFSFAAGDVVSVTVGGTAATYTVQNGDDLDAVMTGIAAAVTTAAPTDVTAAAGAAGSGQLVLTETGGATPTLAVTVTTGGTPAGGLNALGSLSVATETDAASALTEIEGLIQTATDAASAFGSVQTRIETQSKFIDSLTDSLKSGIGAIVDANMNEEAARLKALQTQQQLGIQALSIANQAPQSLLALFQ